MTALLEVAGLSVVLAGRTLCRELKLTIEPGQCWALLGRNGVGKSTLLHRLAGLNAGADDDVRLLDTPLHSLTPRQRARRVGLLLQNSSRGFGGSVSDAVMSGRYPHLSPLIPERPVDRAAVQRALHDLGLEPLAGRTLDNLPGGELRRVELARLVAQQSPLNLLDEPLNHLDPAHQAHALAVVLRRCVGPHSGAMIVAHDLNLAYQACDQWLILEPNGDWRSGTRETMADPDLLSHAFGHRIDRLQHGRHVIFAPRFVEARASGTAEHRPAKI